MKKIIVLTAFFIASTAIIQTAEAQVRVTVNISSQPIWGPVGYDYVEYYYIPDIDVYYYVPTHRYVYQEQGHWIFAPALPVRYRTFNLYNSYKVVINEPRAYAHHSVHVVNYKKYKGYEGKQVVIVNSKDAKYDAAKKNNNGKEAKQNNKQQDNKNKKDNKDKQSNKDKQDNKSKHGKH